MVKNNIAKGESKVSVIIPVYNVEKYLEECLESLLNQTLSEIDIILIDDGSTDSSGKICDGYVEAYDNIRVIHKINEGQGKARNIGIKEAKGKYVYFMDSDDILEKDALSFLCEEAETKNLDVILFAAECFSDDPEVNFNSKEYQRTIFLNEVMSGKDLFNGLYLSKEYSCSIPMRFYNRNYLDKKGFLFPENIIHEDEIYGFLSLIEAKRVECVPFKFYKRRFRKGSTMTSKKAYKSAIGYAYTWKETINICKNKELNEEKIYMDFAHNFFAIIRDLYYSAFTKEEKRKFKKVRCEMRFIMQNSKKKINPGDRFFLLSPFAYKQYRKILSITKR